MKAAVTLTCSICGNSASGTSAFSKIKLCESLGRPVFRFDEGDIVQFKSFHWKVIGRKYRRRGKKHVGSYRIEVIKSLSPRLWTDGIGPVGKQETVDEKNLTLVNIKN